MREGMRIFKIQLPMLLLIELSLLLPGCSGSRQTPVFDTTAPRSTNPVTTDPKVIAILQQSCFECHSSGGRAPWYATLSPTYLAANSARRVLNFSDWHSYDAEKKANALKKIAQTVSGGAMPPGDYTALDHSARLTEDQKQALLNWAAQSALPAHELTSPTK